MPKVREVIEALKKYNPNAETVSFYVEVCNQSEMAAPK